MANTMTLEFAGDAAKLQQAAKQARAAVDSVGQASRDAGAQMDQGAADATRFEQRMGSLGSATTGLTDAVDGLGGGLQAVADVQDHARASQAKLARASVDVMQATEDMAQAQRDATQATIDADQAVVDLEQAHLDEATALTAFNEAVAEFGRNSVEAEQASIDLSQAGIDVRQAMEDSEQATRDASQANIDGTAAQVDLNDAMHEANPPELQGWADKLNLITPLLTAMIGITSLVTAAQWLFNASLWASPITWVVVGIVALIAIIALLVIKWDWVKEKGVQAWRWIKNAASDAWDWMKKLPGRIGDAFASVGTAIQRPFKSAFNSVADAWNSTVGSFSWSVPGWVPGLGGNSISVPKMRKYHTGGTIPGLPGQEVPFMGLAGEQVVPAGRSGHGETLTVQVMLDSDVLVEGTARGVSRRGGNVQLVLGGRNAA